MLTGEDAGMGVILRDPSMKGWATFLVYCLITAICAANAHISRVQVETVARKAARGRTRARFWLILALFLLMLGLTRLLNLQLLIADMARAILRSDGVYDDRGGLQIALTVTIGLFGAVGLLTALITFRRLDGAVLGATVAATALALFTTIRAISLHSIDRFLIRNVGLPHLQINNIIELGLLAFVGLAAFAFARLLREEGQSARLRSLQFEERRRILSEKRRASQS